MNKRKLLSLFTALILIVSIFTGCSAATATEDADTAKTNIAVAVYSITDSEVLAYKNYLEQYIESCFDNVNFIYSNAISNSEEEMEFLKTAAEYGCRGVMSFITYDIQQEVAFCAEQGMYYMMASGTISSRDFNSVKDNEYFLGVVGPGEGIEHQAGADMVHNFYERNLGSDYVILTGGASLGNEMHLCRAVGMLEELASLYNVKLPMTADYYAAKGEINTIDCGAFTVTTIPGYLGYEPWHTAAVNALESGSYNYVMSVFYASQVADAIHSDAAVGVVDCFSEEYIDAFNNGDVQYLCGKYASIIGPSFMAMENAITGNAAAFRDNGEAFRITQGFWSAASAEEFHERYAYSCGIEVNAYNYEDLSKADSRVNPNANLSDLESLAGAYSFEAAAARRNAAG